MLAEALQMNEVVSRRSPRRHLWGEEGVDRLAGDSHVERAGNR